MKYLEIKKSGIEIGSPAYQRVRLDLLDPERIVRREDRKRRGDACRARDAAARARRLARVVMTPEQVAEKSRISSLKAYHAKAEKYNAARRSTSQIERAFRAVLKRRTEGRIDRLERAFRKSMRRAHNRAEERVRKAIRRRFEQAFKRRGISVVVQDLSGISLAGLRQHLESLFQPGMTWDNYGFYGWHIDHKRPLASFVLPDQQAEAFHYTNLQPLWWRDNLSKGSKHV